MNPKAPRALQELLARSHDKPQRAIPWPRDRWQKRFPEESLFQGQRLPEDLDRSSVRDICQNADVSVDSATDAFLAAMAWGYGKVGYGPWRVKQAFQAPDAGKKLHEVAMVLARDGPTAAYDLMGGTSRLPRIGPAFGSKFLFFADSGIHRRRALILDLLVAKWLRRNTDFHPNPVPWDPGTYSAYLDHMHEWAAALDVQPEALELAMFQEMAASVRERFAPVPVPPPDTAGPGGSGGPRTTVRLVPLPLVGTLSSAIACPLPSWTE